jgi:hypothetical protein
MKDVDITRILLEEVLVVIHGDLELRMVRLQSMSTVRRSIKQVVG